jgi:hypothetical protein
MAIRVRGGDVEYVRLPHDRISVNLLESSVKIFIDLLRSTARNTMITAILLLQGFI